ncbi:30S ribosomal protein S16 [Candidatus Parcubacteria bacterium]|nr:30S ribosomal protein S16 [Candidatus Parcubacteria bacterium]
MLVMRLQRIGKKSQAYFRVIVTEHTKKPQGEFLELLGSYDPHKKDLKVKKDRIEYWLSKGVRPSPTVNNLLVNKSIISAPKMLSWKPKVKAKTAAPAEAAKASAPAESAPEAPVEEPKEEAAQ